MVSSNGIPLYLFHLHVSIDTFSSLVPLYCPLFLFSLMDCEFFTISYAFTFLYLYSFIFVYVFLYFCEHTSKEMEVTQKFASLTKYYKKHYNLNI